jgi:hypothetical protein
MARLYVAAFLKNDRQIRCLVKLPLRVYNPDSPSGTPSGSTHSSFHFNSRFTYSNRSDFIRQYWLEQAPSLL